MPRKVKMLALNDGGTHPMFSQEAQKNWNADAIDALRFVMHHVNLKPVEGDDGYISMTRDQSLRMQEMIQQHATYMLIDNVPRRV
jgi:hypothetical protein